MRVKPTPVFFLFTILLVQFSLPGAAYSVAIGMPESTLKVGYGVGMGRLSIEDPDGASASENGVQPFRVIVADWLRGDIRYWGELFFQSATLSASQMNIGQTVGQYGVQLSAQKNLKVGGHWYPWLGVGVDLSRVSYSRRHTIDSDGFLQNRFSDRNEIDLGIIVNLISETELNRDWDVGAKLEQRFSLSGGIKQLSLSLFLLSHF